MIRIGVLGAAGIAPAALIQPARRRDDVQVTAVASRRPEAAKQFAREHELETAYGSYGELLGDDSLDVIYNALPPSEHARWTIAALAHGKHVLCEKPAAMNAQQARAMVVAANAAGLRLMEAFHYYYHPLTAHVVDLVRSQRLGEIQEIHGTFSVRIPFDPASIRHDPATGGGALMDLGCYPVHWLRTMTGEEPTVLQASATSNALGVDESIEATMRFPSGATGRISASMAVEGFEASLVVKGTAGSVEVDNFLHPQYGHSVRLTAGGVTSTATVDGRATYDYQLDAFVTAIARGEDAPTSGADIVGNMAVIDAIYEAAGDQVPARFF